MSPFRNTIFALVICLTNQVVVSGQNLIPNGEFELGEVPCIDPDTRREDDLLNWFAAPGSGDFFYYHLLLGTKLPVRRVFECGTPNWAVDYSAIKGL